VVNLEVCYHEQKLLKICDHDNIVKVKGVCLDEDQNAHMMLEHAGEGDLSVFLASNTGNIKNRPRLKLSLVRQLVLGVRYMHTRSPPLLHRDLKPKNLLVFKGSVGGYSLKICDLGASSLVSQDMTPPPISKGYAPFDQRHGQSSAQNDIYAVGVIIFEVLLDGDIWKGD